jgi:hypothetical protein
MNETAQQAHPFPRSVEAFEEALERARAGKIAAFAIMTIDPNGVVGWKWHFGMRPQTDMIGGLACMNWAITNNAMNPPPPPPPPPPPAGPDWTPPTNVRQ